MSQSNVERVKPIRGPEFIRVSGRVPLSTALRLAAEESLAEVERSLSVAKLATCRGVREDFEQAAERGMQETKDFLEAAKRAEKRRDRRGGVEILSCGEIPSIGKEGGR